MQHWELGEAIVTADEDRITQVMHNLEAELAETQPKTVIISTEVLSRKTVTAEHLRILTRLFPFASRTWVMVLREQEQLLKSLYSEHLKKGILAWPSDYRALAGPEFLDHVRRLRLLIDASKTDQICVARFADIRQNLVASFLAMIGHPELYVSLAGGTLHENRSVPGRALRLLRYVNALPPFAASALRRRILEYAKLNPELLAGPTIAPASLNTAVAPYLYGNWAIETRIFAHLPVTLTIPSHIARQGQSPELDEIFAARVHGWAQPPADKI